MELILRVLVWYQSKSKQYRYNTLLEDAVIDFKKYEKQQGKIKQPFNQINSITQDKALQMDLEAYQDGLFKYRNANKVIKR